MPRPVRHLAPQMLVALTLTQSFGADNCQKLQSKPRADSLGDGCDIGLHSSCSHPLLLAVPVSHFPKYCLTGGSTLDFDCRTRKISLTYRERVRTHRRDQRGSRPRGAVNRLVGTRSPTSPYLMSMCRRTTRNRRSVFTRSGTTQHS
jgi:hypothetical protein